MSEDIHSLSHMKWNCKYRKVFAPKFLRRSDRIREARMAANSAETVSVHHRQLSYHISQRQPAYSCIPVPHQARDRWSSDRSQVGRVIEQVYCIR